MIYITGTTSKKIKTYIDRVASLLEINDANIDLDIMSKCMNGAGGYADGDEDLITVEIARADTAGKIPTKNIMVNIAHEMIHAQQLHTGRMINKGLDLVYGDDGGISMINVVVWDGQEISGIPYSDHPWEIDAYGRELSVYEACK